MSPPLWMALDESCQEVGSLFMIFFIFFYFSPKKCFNNFLQTECVGFGFGGLGFFFFIFGYKLSRSSCPVLAIGKQ